MIKRTAVILLLLGVLVGIAACQLPFSTGNALVMATQTPIVVIETMVLPASATPALFTSTPEPETPTPEPSIPATATETPTTTLTGTPLPSRGGGTFFATYLNSPPVIDGIWDEWSNTAYNCNAVVYGAGERKDAADLGASLRIGWDWNNLYLAVKIGDDVYVQNASGQDLYKGDSLELLFDTYLYDDFYWGEMSGDDYQLGISPGNPNVSGIKEAVAWFPRSGNGARNSVVIGSVRDEGITRMEVAIPWSVLGVSPYAWAHYGFALSVSDNDNPNENVQQSMISCVPGRRLLDPTTWGELILTQ
jgi:hypothetical protein